MRFEAAFEKPVKMKPIFLVALGGAIGLAIWRRKDLMDTAALVFPDHAAEERAIRKALIEAAVMDNLNEDFVQAIAKVESQFRMNVVNKKGRDGERGGSWGPTQISEKTVRALGYTGPMEAFLSNPTLAAMWTAKILNDHRSRGKLKTLADYVAAWNAGKDGADKNSNNELEELSASNTARSDYLPKAKTALIYVQSTKGGFA